MLNFTNEEICFLSIVLNEGLIAINKDREAVEIKKVILENIFKLEDLKKKDNPLKEKLEKEIEKYDVVFKEYLTEKEGFTQNLYSKLESMFEIIKENDLEAYSKAEYFAHDKPLEELFKRDVNDIIDGGQE